MNRVNVQISPGFFLTVAVGILLVPFRWLAAWFIASTVHEVFHLLAILLCKLPVRSVTIGSFGTVISVDMQPGRKMAFCALAGPVGGLLLLFLLRLVPRIALCGLIQSLYNLLPIYPLDGGRVLTGLLTPLLSANVVKHIQAVIEGAVMGILILAALYALFVLKLGILPAVFVAAVIIKNKKIPCKRLPLRVQ